MIAYEIDPLADARWKEFLQRHARASVFHTPGWLEALQRTYGYRPVVFTTSPPAAELTNGIVFCRIQSWLTGRRLVSLPFSDHCEPLVNTPEDFRVLSKFLKEEQQRQRWKYIEVRPLSNFAEGSALFGAAGTFYFHKLDLRPGPEALFRNFHKNCVRRKIRRAERESLTYEEGRSEALLRRFYGLMVGTRRRHRLPPQPLEWFRNLVDCLGESLKIRVASKEGRAVAGILTLSYKKTLVYKYGCSDSRAHKLGGMHFLFWKAIQDAKGKGVEEFDYGRSDLDNAGLVNFKDRWGASRSTLTYLRYPSDSAQTLRNGRQEQIAKWIFAGLPDALLTKAGRLLYKHIG